MRQSLWLPSGGVSEGALDAPRASGVHKRVQTDGIPVDGLVLALDDRGGSASTTG
jgi:hypothetical protein